MAPLAPVPRNTDSLTPPSGSLLVSRAGGPEMALWDTTSARRPRPLTLSSDPFAASSSCEQFHIDDDASSHMEWSNAPQSASALISSVESEPRTPFALGGTLPSSVDEATIASYNGPRAKFQSTLDSFPTMLPLTSPPAPDTGQVPSNRGLGAVSVMLERVHSESGVVVRPSSVGSGDDIGVQRAGGPTSGTPGAKQDGASSRSFPLYQRF